jgi:hypothetical protein
VGTASYGPQLSATAISAQIVLGLDAANAAGPSTTDGCSPFSNAAQVAGRIALVDRGTCAFVVKTANAQAAGAVALLVADNVAGTPPAGLGGAAAGITIPSVRLTITDGNTIKAQLASGVSAQLGLNMAQRAGADSAGRVFVNATNPIVPGSSISHWDPVAFPNLLMEPTSDPAITHSLVPPNDLTLAQMRDIGWFADADNDGFANEPDECDASILSPTVVVADERLPGCGWRRRPEPRPVRQCGRASRQCLEGRRVHHPGRAKHNSERRGEVESRQVAGRNSNGGAEPFCPLVRHRSRSAHRQPRLGVNVSSARL